MKPSPAPIEWVFRLVVLLAVAAVPLAMLAQGQGQVEVRGFKFADYFPAPHELQMSWLLQGARARPLADGRTYVIEEATLQTFSSDPEGRLQLVLRAPQCFLMRPNAQENMKPSARSAGPILAQTADGLFSIEGVGFLSQQADPSLIISNRVHSVIHAAMLGNPTASDASRTNSWQVIEIFSDRFDYSTNSGLATYRDHVRLTGTNLSLSSGLLECMLPVGDPRRPEERRLQRVTAQNQVVLDYDLSPSPEDHLHATGDQAVYGVNTGLIEVTGKPTWQAGRRQGGGDRLLIDRTNRIFRATGHAALTMPAGGLETSSFIPSPASSAAPSAPAASPFVEVNSDAYEIHTNAALFQGPVHVTERAGEQSRGTLDCGRMALRFEQLQGTNELQSLVAEDHVLIRQTQGQLSGGKAVYTAATRQMELTQNPAWRGLASDGKSELSGKGETILIDGVRSNMTVDGNAMMRLPAADLSRAVALSDPASTTPRAQPRTNETADVFSSQYEVQATNVIFRGGVYVSHPRLHLECETLTVGWTTNREKDSMIAEEKVTFDLAGENDSTNKPMQVHGTGDRAVCTYTVTPTATNTFLTNSLLRLFGSPAMLHTTFETNTAVATNNVLVLDLIKKTLVAEGNYAITGTAPAMTNKPGSPDKLLK